MKVSFITIVLNEEKTIDSFLGSLRSQSKKPDEVVIVDGNSTDETVERIKNYESRIKEKRIEFKLIVKKGNRSVGRNEAIKNATGDIIISSDAGCVLDKNWVKNITEPFKSPKVDVVAGYYKPITNNIFEKCLSAYTCVMEDRLDKNNFLPSSRSIAFRKSVWEKSGGYPQNLNTCEDLVFASRLKKQGYIFVFQQNAFVLWPQKKNIKEAFKQLFSYATGDGQAHYFRPQTPFLFLRYLIGFVLLIVYFAYKSYVILNTFILLLFLYLAWSIYKNYQYVNHIKAFFILPLLQFTSDAAVIFGTVVGLLKSVKFRKE